jgi:hypothetical protein
MNFEDLIKIIGPILTVLIPGYIGYRQYMTQKNENAYSANLKMIYSPRKDEVLAAIADLETFRSSPKLQKITTNILINRLYTELDYNVCHAIANQLVTMIRREDTARLNEIIDRLIGINYNYFSQGYSLKGRIHDLEKTFNELEINYVEQLKNKKDEMVVIGLLDDLKMTTQQKWKELQSTKDENAKILWHKQVMADTLGIVISRATASGFHNIKAHFSANDFNFCTFRKIFIHECKMEKSAFGQALFQDVSLDNVLLEDNTLSNSLYENTVFKNGVIRATTFHGSSFNNVKFENIVMIDTCFLNCTFDNCYFKLNDEVDPAWFFNSNFFNTSFLGVKLNILEEVKRISRNQFLNKLKNSKFFDTRKKDIEEFLNSTKDISGPETSQQNSMTNS